MLFTNGFIISRVELDTLVNLLLDASSGRTTSHRRNSMLTGDEITERFSDIDTDNSGGKYFLCKDVFIICEYSMVSSHHHIISCST